MIILLLTLLLFPESIFTYFSVSLTKTSSPGQRKSFLISFVCIYSFKQHTYIHTYVCLQVSSLIFIQKVSNLVDTMQICLNVKWVCLIIHVRIGGQIYIYIHTYMAFADICVYIDIYLTHTMLYVKDKEYDQMSTSLGRQLVDMTNHPLLFISFSLFCFLFSCTNPFLELYQPNTTLSSK